MLARLDFLFLFFHLWANRLFCFSFLPYSIWACVIAVFYIRGISGNWFPPFFLGGGVCFYVLSYLLCLIKAYCWKWIVTVCWNFYMFFTFISLFYPFVKVILGRNCHREYSYKTSLVIEEVCLLFVTMLNQITVYLTRCRYYVIVTLHFWWLHSLMPSASFGCYRRQCKDLVMYRTGKCLSLLLKGSVSVTWHSKG